MTTIHATPDGDFISFTKGAAEVVVARSIRVATSAGPALLATDHLMATAEGMAADGLRVLAIGMRRWPELPPAENVFEVEHDLTLLGLVGLLDPPREEARAAVATCRQAGIVPVMITGDHPSTARAIARRLGILEDHAEVLTGRELATMPDEALGERIGRVRVYARVAPEQKLRIVRALQARGEIVAMTGDGVNDAPALEQADIGVAMGITGTDVARKQARMVLLDDNFATIVRGRARGPADLRQHPPVREVCAHDELRRGLDDLSGAVPRAADPAAAHPHPVDQPRDRRPPRPRARRRARGARRDAAAAAAARTKGVFAHGLGGSCRVGRNSSWRAWRSARRRGSFERGSAHWQTMVFTVLAFSQLAHVLAIRSERDSLLSQGLLSNRPLATAVALTVALQLAVVYLPALNVVFVTEPLTPGELLVAVGVSSLVFVAVELEKWVKRAGDCRAEPGRRRGLGA